MKRRMLICLSLLLPDIYRSAAPPSVDANPIKPEEIDCAQRLIGLDLTQAERDSMRKKNYVVFLFFFIFIYSI